jgi:predicted nucleotidyltransferase
MIPELQVAAPLVKNLPALPLPAIAKFCQQHHIRKLSLFGSVLRDDFGPESDVDVIAEFESTFCYSLIDLLRMEEQLSLIFRWPVDLSDRQSIEEDPNYLRRRAILHSAQVVYAQ